MRGKEEKEESDRKKAKEEGSGIDMNQQIRGVSEPKEDEQETKEVEGVWKRKMMGAWQQMKTVMIGGKRKKRSG